MQALDACVFAKTEEDAHTQSVDVYLGFEDGTSEDDIADHIRAVIRLYERANGREAHGEVAITDGAQVIAQNPIRSCQNAEAAVRRSRMN
jgi:hypothetical protein